MEKIIPDAINGSFELVSGLLVWLNVRQVLKDRQVHGVSLLCTGFFVAWGYWNLYYYPSLAQHLSFVGGVVMSAGNTVWFVLLLKHRTKASKK